MRFMVLAMANGEVCGAVTRTKFQAFEWKAFVEAELEAEGMLPVKAWRYHDGNGWADGSPDAWRHVDHLPSHVAVEIYR